MTITTKFDIGNTVYFLSYLGDIEGGKIDKISIDVSKKNKYIYYIIDCFNKNLSCTSKIEHEIFLTLEELNENIEEQTKTSYKYK